MHQLLPDDVVGGGQRPGKRQHNPALGCFRDAARPFSERPLDGIGLPEVRTAGIQDQRLPLAQLVI